MSLFEEIINQKKKDWAAPDMMDFEGKKLSGKLPFSSPLMSYCTYGGIPRNKITEFFGEPSGGKSTTAVDVCKNAIEVFHEEYEEQIRELRKKASASDASKTLKAQLIDLEERGPKKVLYIDLEHSFDAEWSKTLGIDNSEINVMQPPNVTAEEVLQMIQEVVESGEVGLIVLDSLPSLVPKSELEKKYGERTVASLAGLLTIFCRKIVSMLTRYECTLLFINQIRQNMDNPYVVKTPGGEAPKFYASLRIQFQIGNPVDILGNELPKSATDPAGYIINAKIVKQKSAPNNRKNGSYFLICDSGIREDMDYAELAITKYGVIKKSAGWFTVCDPDTGEVLQDDGKILKLQGKAKVYEFLQSNRAYFNKLKAFIDRDISGEPEEGKEDEESDKVL